MLRVPARLRILNFSAEKKRFIGTVMNQETCGESGPSPHVHDDVQEGKEHPLGTGSQNNQLATPSWTNVPFSAFLIRKPISRKLTLAAKFDNFPAGAVRMVSTDMRASDDDPSNPQEQTKEPPLKICKKEALATKSGTLICSPPEVKAVEDCADLSTSVTKVDSFPDSPLDELRVKCSPTQMEESTSQENDKFSEKFPEGAAKVFKFSLNNFSTPVHSPVPATSNPDCEKPLEDLQPMETDTSTDEVISKLRSTDSKAVSEGEVRPFLLMEADVKSSLLEREIECDQSVSDQQLLEDHETNFLFTMDVEGLLIENQHKQKSRKRKKSQGSSDVSTDRRIAFCGPSDSSSCEQSTMSVAKCKNRWGHKRLKKDSTREEQNSESEGVRKSSPNAFVSIRIPSAEIRDKLGEIQRAMVAYDKTLQSTLVSLDKLHLTLFVLRLDSEEERVRAKAALLEAMQRVATEMEVLSSPIVLEFGGVSSFSTRVVFAAIKENPAKERLTSVAEMVRSVFELHELYSTDDRAFNPHLTIAKTSKSPRMKKKNKKKMKKGPRGIAKEAYLEYRDAELGCEVVRGLELLSMVEPADEDGYYHCFKRHLFEEAINTKTDQVNTN